MSTHKSRCLCLVELLLFFGVSPFLDISSASVVSRPAAVRMEITLKGLTLSDDAHADFVVYRGADMEETTKGFLRAAFIAPQESDTFREAIRRKTLAAEVVVPWKVVACLVHDSEEFQDLLLSAVATFPDADVVVLVANGVTVTDTHLPDLNEGEGMFEGDILLHTLPQAMSAEDALSAAWALFPPETMVVAFCLDKCAPALWPLMPHHLQNSPNGMFLHYVRVVWSYVGKFSGPLVAVVPRTTCPQPQGHGLRCQTPSLLMFDSATIAHFGLPNWKDGDINAWLNKAARRSRVYIGSADGANASIVPSNSTTMHQAELTASAASTVRFNVLVLVEGSKDKITRLIFEDVANIVHGGLQSLGHKSRIVYCNNLVTTQCFEEDEVVIALAPHILASYFTTGGTLAAMERTMLPQDAVLYNFEHIPHPCDVPPATAGGEGISMRNNSVVSHDTLAIYAQHPGGLWEFAEENFHIMRSMGILSELVPLGFSSELISADTTRADNTETIDVLFLGLETSRRRMVIEQLRASGLSVVHPNSGAIELYGKDFDAAAAKSKIVLNLNAFFPTNSDCAGAPASFNHGEWKITRLARLLANSRFVVSEMSGSKGERAKYEGGVVFATTHDLAETCEYYLARPSERIAIAERGHEIYKSEKEAEILRGPVENVLLRRAKQLETRRLLQQSQTSRP